jgi:hypothetical protein
LEGLVQSDAQHHKIGDPRAAAGAVPGMRSRPTPSLLSQAIEERSIRAWESMRRADPMRRRLSAQRTKTFLITLAAVAVVMIVILALAAALL